MTTKLKILFVLNILLISTLNAQRTNIDSLLRVADTSNNLGKAKTYIQVSYAYYRYSLPKYYEYALKANSFAKLTDDDKVLAHSNHLLGVAHNFMGQPDSAIFYYNEVMKYADRHADTTRKTILLRNIGIIYQNMGRDDKADEYYNNSLFLAEQVGDSSNMVLALMSMATKSNSSMDFNKAIETNLRALKIAETNHYEEKIPIVLNTLSVTFGMMEDYKKALYYQRKALLYKDTINDKKGMASAYTNLGLVFKKMGILDSAEYYYEIALKLNNALGELRGLMIVYDNIASLYLEQKQYNKALNMYLKGIKIAGRSKDMEYIALYNSDIGKVYFEMGDYENANRYFLNSLKLVKRGVNTERTIQLYYNLYKLNKKTGNTSKALYYSDKYHSIKDSVLNIEKQKQINDLETKYQTEKKEDEILLLTKEKELKDIEIEKQKTLTYMMVAFALMVLFAAILFFSRYRLKQQHKQSKLEKEKFETEGKLLRSQMNPHFLFNSLNSIQSFISSNEQFKAMTYLSKFGKLTRDILEYSRESFITLEEEISSLELYIELELLRQKETVEYSIKVADDINTEIVLIPPIIVQPFVENALKHGLRQKQGVGLLEISFQLRGDNLICTVTDNGIGRKASMEKKDKDHQSLGMQITAERLKNLNTKSNTNIKFVITDLYDDAGNSRGTKVEIILPGKLA